MTCVMTANFASAAGLNLSWDDCGAAGAADKDFACDTNSGTHTLVCSLVAPPDALGIDYADGDISLRQWADPFPSWWDTYKAGTCRQTDIVSDLTFAGLSACTRAWPASAIGGIAKYAVDFTGYPSWRLLSFVIAVPSADKFDMVEGREYYVAKIVIDNGKTVGAGACSGCTEGIDLVFARGHLSGDGGPFFDIDYPATGNAVTWQGGKVPTLNRSWGSIKTLWR